MLSCGKLSPHSLTLNIYIKKLPNENAWEKAQANWCTKTQEWISNKGQYSGLGSWRDEWDLSKEKEGQGKREKRVLLGNCSFLFPYPWPVSLKSTRFLCNLLSAWAKGWFDLYLILSVSQIPCSLLILSPVSFSYLLRHQLLLYNCNGIEAGTLWTAVEIHKIHQKVLLEHKKNQFMFSEIWHWTSIIL